MRRSTAFPLVATVVLGSLVAVGVLWLMASLEFSQWEHRRQLSLLPAISKSYRSVQPFGWSLPVAAIAIGAYLLARRECDARWVSWYFGVVALLTVVWTAFGVLALYLMYASTNHQL